MRHEALERGRRVTVVEQKSLWHSFSSVCSSPSFSNKELACVNLENARECKRICMSENAWLCMYYCMCADFWMSLQSSCAFTSRSASKDALDRFSFVVKIWVALCGKRAFQSCQENQIKQKPVLRMMEPSDRDNAATLVLMKRRLSLSYTH